MTQPNTVLFSYKAFVETLGLLRLRDIVLGLKPSGVCMVKESYEYQRFKVVYNRLAAGAPNANALGQRLREQLKGCRAISEFRARLTARPFSDYLAMYEYLAMVAEYLEVASGIERHLDRTMPLILSPSTPARHGLPGVAGAVRTEATEKAILQDIFKENIFLVIATEWDSNNGGLSTFNREMCLALRRAGQRVYCYVLKASEAEIGEAHRAGIELIVAEPRPGLNSRNRLLSRPILADGVVPDFIVGHDRITGPAANHLATEYYRDSKHIQFIHTAPGEIEWFKSHLTGPGASFVAEERRIAV